MANSYIVNKIKPAYSLLGAIVRNVSHVADQSIIGSPLSGIRILDLTRILAGPFCTMILGDLGAEIIKVEKPGGGDETRSWGPPFLKEESSYFLSVNRNKKSVVVDLKHPKGREIVKQLALKSDILIENFLPGKLDSMGLGYETLSKISSQLIYCSISGFGSSGPYRERAGYDVIAASLGGLLHITGPENGEPCKVGVAMTDLATGLYAHGAILAALLHRSSTGKGQKLECNLLSTQVSLLVHIASSYLNAGQEAKRWGTSHESIVPYQAFQTQDGYLTVGAGSNEHFKILCKVLGMEELGHDSCYSNNEKRVSNRSVLLAKLSDRFSKKSTLHWLEAFKGSGIPYGQINNISQVFEDPQVKYNKIKIDMNHPTCGTIQLLGPAVSFLDCQNKARSPPPTLGQHTTQVLKDLLMMHEDEVKELKTQGVVA